MYNIKSIFLKVHKKFQNREKEDVYQTDTEAYRPLGVFWESLNDHNRWGGNFTTINDANHFERVV